MVTGYKVTGNWLRIAPEFSEGFGGVLEEKVPLSGTNSNGQNFNYGLKNISGWEVQSQREKWNFQRFRKTFVNIDHLCLCR